MFPVIAIVGIIIAAITFIVAGFGIYSSRVSSPSSSPQIQSQSGQLGGGKLTKYMSFKNPYGIIVFLVIAFAIWNFYANKNKTEQEE